MMADIEIITVKRPHSWLVKRGESELTCRTCGKLKRQTAGLVCFEEEIEREIAAP